MKEKRVGRGSFGSAFGFVMAAAGSAVGLGNLWKFPYVAGRSGGAVFLIVYLIFVVLLGVPIMLGEMSLGRRTRLNPVGAYRSLDRRWTFVGVIGVLCGFIILSCYSVIGGWVLRYIAAYVAGGPRTGEAAAFFSGFVSSPVEPVLWHLLFLGVTCLVVMKGISGGIERVSKVLLPALFVIILIIAVRALTLPGSGEGVRYFLVPNWSDVDSLPKFGNVVFSAMGQVFFSLSLGMGTLITYGSYLPKKVNLQRSSLVIPALDTLMAILAGFAILPAVFAFGFQPSAGPGLLFETLPEVFASMPFGGAFGLLFFVLVFFAAITSSVSMLEVVTAFAIDNLHWKRRTASLSASLLMAVSGTVAALSYGPLGDMQIFGMTIFDALTYLSDKILMPVGGFCMCIFVGYVWGIDNATAEITENGALNFGWKKLFGVSLRYIAPALILVIFLVSLITGG